MIPVKNHLITQADSYFGAQLTHLLKIAETSGYIGNRTSVRTVKDFGAMSVYDLSEGFPILNLKRVHWKSVVHELIWFLRGDTNVKYLRDNGVTIWDEWADKNGELGQVYGFQWRRWDRFETEAQRIDQVASVIKTLRESPQSRRMIVSAWNPVALPRMALEPCHVLWQLDVGHDGKLNMLMFQRSADLFLGVPFNVASYALLLSVLAKMVGREPGNLIHSIGNFHLYENHASLARDLLERIKEEIWKRMSDDGEKKGDPIFSKVTLELSDRVSSFKDPSELQFSDCKLVNYNPWPAVKAEVAV